MLADPHFQERGLFEEVKVDGESLRIPAIAPKLCDTPGETRWPGGAVGSHNREIYQSLLGLGDSELEQLQDQGVI
jgi:crotonobetainyl-CoA:carnitine CoA-transferase CaiB-like acyl-CoA transferase